MPRDLLSFSDLGVFSFALFSPSHAIVSGYNPHFLTACQTAAPFGCQIFLIILLTDERFAEKLAHTHIMYLIDSTHATF